MSIGKIDFLKKVQDRSRAVCCRTIREKRNGTGRGAGSAEGIRITDPYG